MANKRTTGNLKYWDPIVSSTELKKQIKERATRHHVEFFKLAEEIEVDYEYLKKNYLNKTNVISTPSLRPQKIINLAKLVGIDVRITVVLEPEETYIGKLKQIRNRPYKHNGRTKEKGVT